MKAKLKYPIFWSGPNDNRVYVFWKEKENKTTKLDMLKEANGWKGDMIIDATGTKYIVKCSYMTKWKGIHGFTGGFTGMIYYEQEYEDNPESLSLQQLQDRIAERYPKTRWFREEGWGSRDDFRRTVYACKTFEELAGLFRHPPETLRTRIIKWLHPTRKELKMRIGTVLFLILYLLVCYLIFEYNISN